MMNLEDTIAAVSSACPTAGTAAFSILRISGPKTFAVIKGLFPDFSFAERRGITHTALSIEKITVPAALYAFKAPHSYTGQDMIELHITAAGPAAEVLFQNLLTRARQAQPGEFTWRAYINGRMDLTQAEAVAQIVTGSNAAQLTAAEKLLAGNLSAEIASIRSGILDLLSRIEAGLDFAEEDIEFISPEQAAQTLKSLTARLDHLLSSTIRYERMIDLPSVGIAGAVNAGKSSLLNALLQRDRSIVSDRSATTRDVLSEILSLGDLDCVLFDCAGLADAPAALDPLDALARQAARTALRQADAVLFCVNIAKDNLADDRAVHSLLGTQAVLAVAAQCDRLKGRDLSVRLNKLEQEFGCSFLSASARTGTGIKELKAQIRKVLLDLRGAASQPDQRIAVNQRHRQILTEAAAAMTEAETEIRKHHDEIAAMLLRTARQQLGGVEREDIEESVLEQIFSRFCVGK